MSVYKVRFRKNFVILAEAVIQCFQCLPDPPVKPEDDNQRLYTQTLINGNPDERLCGERLF